MMMTLKSDQQGKDLALIQSATLRGIYDRAGKEAFDDVAARLLTQTAALIAKVSGPQQLKIIIKNINEAQRRESLQ